MEQVAAIGGRLDGQEGKEGNALISVEERGACLFSSK